MMSGGGRDGTAGRSLLESRLPYHLRCLCEDATDPELTSLERLALICDHARRKREIRGTLNDDKLRAAIPLGNALRNSPPCVPAIGHLRMPRRANSHQFVASVASREGTLARV